MQNYKKKREHYFGIDLGTTNSVLAWAREPAAESFIEPEVVNITMPQVIQGNNPEEFQGWPQWAQGQILPSCVWFPPGGGPWIVGPPAKEALKSTRQRVVKSNKTKMGSTDPLYTFDDSQYAPTDIAAKTLKALVEGLPADVPRCELLEEVVIGVPASFDNPRRTATLEAAKLAGFKNTILVDEPCAALYDYQNQQNRRLFPLEAIGIQFNLDQPKLILVFDLGGGTLDVSLHEVTCGSKNHLSIENSVASRYTAIGGDNFDILLAKYFIREAKSSVHPSFVQEYAESAKIQLSNEARSNPTTASTQIHIPPLGITFDLTLAKYENIVSLLLAYDLTLETVKSNNIVYPILDVLKKWENEFGSIPTPNGVLLNGAMTRLYTIQKRLESFFPGVSISTIGDPDKSVARGAVVHHYNHHHP